MKNVSFNVQFVFSIGLSLGLLSFSGCGSQEKGNKTDTPTPPSTTAPPATAEVHAHPSEGPHHGGLIELGNEEYHIEIVHDDAAGTVTAYILDSAAKESVPIYATELLVNLSHDGQAEQFKLAASPQPSDPAGKSSKFVSTDKELAEDLDNDAVSAQIVVTIAGKQYRGKIQHDHEGHDHGDHEGHDHGDHEGHGDHDEHDEHGDHDEHAGHDEHK